MNTNFRHIITSLIALSTYLHLYYKKSNMSYRRYINSNIFRFRIIYIEKPFCYFGDFCTLYFLFDGFAIHIDVIIKILRDRCKSLIPSKFTIFSKLLHPANNPKHNISAAPIIVYSLICLFLL